MNQPIGVRLLLAAAMQAGINEAHLCRILEITIPKLHWLARRGMGRVKSLKSSELIS
jgi:hypothetical protein